MHVMVDIETLSTQPNAAILSIGAVKFDVQRGIIEKFYTGISLESCMDRGMVVDADTIKWWMSQSEETRSVFNGTTNVTAALMMFREFLPKENFFLWGNGANFDPVILGSAYASCGMYVPWNFRNVRCYRTLLSLFPDTPKQPLILKHNAIDDAVVQALTAIDILRRLPTCQP